MGLNPPNWTSETGGGLADWGGGGQSTTVTNP